MTFEEFGKKEVICIGDCKRLGVVADLQFDPCTGCIHKITVMEGRCFFNSLLGKESYEIPFSQIKQIGEDIILVDYCR